MTFSSFRVRHQTALLLVAGGAVLTLASVGRSQVQSPIDPTINQSSDVQTTDAQNAAALNLMMNWVESTLGPQLGMDNPRQESLRLLPLQASAHCPHQPGMAGPDSD